MDNSSKSQASASDDRFLGESMLRRIANFGLEKNTNQTKHWMPDSAGKKRPSSIHLHFSSSAFFQVKNAMIAKKNSHHFVDVIIVNKSILYSPYHSLIL